MIRMRGLPGNGARDLDDALFGHRQALDVLVRIERLEAQLGEELGGADMDGLVVDLLEAEARLHRQVAEQDILADAEVGHDGDFLRQELYAGGDRVGGLAEHHRLPVDFDGSRHRGCRAR